MRQIVFPSGAKVICILLTIKYFGIPNSVYLSWNNLLGVKVSLGPLHVSL